MRAGKSPPRDAFGANAKFWFCVFGAVAIVHVGIMMANGRAASGGSSASDAPPAKRQRESPCCLCALAKSVCAAPTAAKDMALSSMGEKGMRSVVLHCGHIKAACESRAVQEADAVEVACRIGLAAQEKKTAGMALTEQEQAAATPRVHAWCRTTVKNKGDAAAKAPTSTGAPNARPAAASAPSSRRRKRDAPGSEVKCLLCCGGLVDDVREMNHTYTPESGGADRCKEADELTKSVAARRANRSALSADDEAWTEEVQEQLQLMTVYGEVRMLRYDGDQPHCCHEQCHKNFIRGRSRPAGGARRAANTRNLQVDQRNAFCFALDSFQKSGDAGGDQFMM